MTEKHFIEVENGEKVATLCEETDSEKWFFVCHGLGGNKERQSEYIEPLSKAGFNTVVMDFRGNGEADGEFINQTISSRIKDLKSVVEYFNPEVCILFGTSLGGKVVFHAEPELDADGIIVKSPVTYNDTMNKLRKAVENKGEFEFIQDKPIDKRFFNDLDNYSFDNVADHLATSVAIFHGADDTTVHPEHSSNAVKALDTDVMLQKLEGEKHSFSEEAKTYMFNHMISWLHNNGF